MSINRLKMRMHNRMMRMSIKQIYRLATYEFTPRLDGTPSNAMVLAAYIVSLEPGTRFTMQDIMTATGLTQSQIYTGKKNPALRLSFYALTLHPRWLGFQKPYPI